MPELVKHGESGLVVPPGDDAALAGAMTSLYRQPELALRLGRSAPGWISERFSTGAYLAEHRALFERLAAENRADSAQVSTSPAP